MNGTSVLLLILNRDYQFKFPAYSQRVKREAGGNDARLEISRTMASKIRAAPGRPHTAASAATRQERLKPPLSRSASLGEKRSPSSSMVVRVPTPRFRREDSYEKQEKTHDGEEVVQVVGKFARFLEPEV